jgi:hypothetical protein
MFRIELVNDRLIGTIAASAPHHPAADCSASPHHAAGTVIQGQNVADLPPPFPFEMAGPTFDELQRKERAETQ